VLLRASSAQCEEEQNDERRENHCSSGTKTPIQTSERLFSEISSDADGAIDTIGDQFTPGLNCHQHAEATAENKDWPVPQRTGRNLEKNAKPVHGLAVKNPKPLRSV
jgi:hypothetical protein